MSDQAIQYQPLSQATSSDEDDALQSDRDDLLHIRPAGKKEAIPLRKLGSPVSRSGAPRDGIVRPRRQTRRNFIIVVLLVCVLVGGAVGVAAWAIFRGDAQQGVNNVQHTHPTAYTDWTLFFNQSESESSVTVVDVNGDGLDDMLVGLTNYQQYEAVQHAPGDTMEQRCLAAGWQYPCLGHVVALRGYDGKELWRTWLHSVLIFANCGDLDVNGDGQTDCIFTGREAMVQAVDLATGHIYWTVDAGSEIWREHLVASWNTFRALGLPDVDGDGVKDLIITHGGNQSKRAEDHDRAPGRVIFLSGASGKPLGRYLDLPNSRETYMSPIRHVTANGSSYILLGSGGETVPGDLMIVSDSDLIHYIMAKGRPQLRILFRGSEKGVMIAPVLADMTHDGTPDILMSAFEGVMTLYDGETLQQLWTKELPGMESYSTPALGDFDGDDVLDLMVMWGYGEWAEYDYAIVYLLSGTDGRVLWQAQCQMVQMYSSLTLKTTGPHDLFLFRTVGQVVNTPPLPAAHGKPTVKRHIVSGEASDHRMEDELNESPETFKRMCDHERQKYEEDHLTCSGNLSEGKVQLFLMDKDTANSPPIVFSISPQPYNYNVSVDGSRQHCHDLSPSSRNLVDMCVVQIPRGVTGAVGDVDGDGVPDLIQLDSLQTFTVTDLYDYQSTVGDLVLSRRSLAEDLRGKPDLLHMSRQPWRQFMGSEGDNVYRLSN